VSIAELRAHRRLASMWILRPGNRLSITPVGRAEWDTVMTMLALGLDASQPHRLHSG